MNNLRGNANLSDVKRSDQNSSHQPRHKFATERGENYFLGQEGFWYFAPTKFESFTSS